MENTKCIKQICAILSSFSKQITLEWCHLDCSTSTAAIRLWALNICNIQVTMNNQRFFFILHNECGKGSLCAYTKQLVRGSSQVLTPISKFKYDSSSEGVEPLIGLFEATGLLRSETGTANFIHFLKI